MSQSGPFSDPLILPLSIIFIVAERFAVGRKDFTVRDVVLMVQQQFSFVSKLVSRRPKCWATCAIRIIKVTTRDNFKNKG